MITLRWVSQCLACGAWVYYHVCADSSAVKNGISTFIRSEMSMAVSPIKLWITLSSTSFFIANTLQLTTWQSWGASFTKNYLGTFMQAGDGGLGLDNELWPMQCLSSKNIIWSFLCKTWQNPWHWNGLQRRQWIHWDRCTAWLVCHHSHQATLFV